MTHQESLDTSSSHNVQLPGCKGYASPGGRLLRSLPHLSALPLQPPHALLLPLDHKINPLEMASETVTDVIISKNIGRGTHELYNRGQIKDNLKGISETVRKVSKAVSRGTQELQYGCTDD